MRPAVTLGIVLLAMAMGSGCSNGYKETIVPAKEFTPLERARLMLEGYAAGQQVGSEFMGFDLLKEELVKSSPEKGGMVAEAIAEIEKVIRQPAKVKAIAERTLAELDQAAAPAQ